MVFLDANIVIYAFKPEYSYLGHLLAAKDQDIACSDMVRLEVMGFGGLRPAERRELEKFFQEVTVSPIDSKIVDIAITLLQKRNIGAPDAIIAATALITKQRLWTSNERDFEWIEGLDWHNPIMSPK